MDGLILSINNKFLINLKSNGFNIKSLKCKVITNPTKNNTKFIRYNNLEDYNNLVFSIINSSNFLSNVGDFFIINNIVLENTNLKFRNNYKISDIFDSLIINKSIEFNSIQTNNWTAEISRYENFIIGLINEYILNINSAIVQRV